METTTHKGERCLIIGNYKYALRYQGSAMWTWRRATRLYNASVHTRASYTSIFDDASNIQHNHAASVRDSSFEMAKSTYKRKATCRPSKILRTDGHVNASVSITSTDLRSIRQTMYRSSFELAKRQHLNEWFRKYDLHEVTRCQFLHHICYKFLYRYNFDFIFVFNFEQLIQFILRK